MHPKRMLRLERLRTATGNQLARRLKEEIKRELLRLELVLQMIKAIETERDAIASVKAPTHTNAKKIQKLVNLRGIGPELPPYWRAKYSSTIQQSPQGRKLRRADAEPFPAGQ
jgi:hypothetical protein